MKTIKIADISKTPGARYKSTGPYSAEWFYDNHILPAFKEAVKTDTLLSIDLDGTEGYADSFLDELFGRLTYENGVILPFYYLRITSFDEPHLIEEIAQYMIGEYKKEG